MPVPKKLDEKTIDALNDFFDELDNTVKDPYAKLKTALINSGLAGTAQSNITIAPSIQSSSFTTNVVSMNKTSSYISSAFAPHTAANSFGGTGAVAYSSPNASHLTSQVVGWRMVMGLITDEETGHQKYITKAYYCLNRQEAKRNFVSEHTDKTFTAVFVMEPVGDE